MAEQVLPTVIQGGMGVAVSSWPLAQAVAATGQLGVVSGTALDLVLARRLEDGDPDGSTRRALSHFPDQAMAQRLLDKYFVEGGRPADRPYRPVPKMSLPLTKAVQELAIVGNFVEVWLAKEGHDGPIGINYLEKIQLVTPASALGAMLAGVDYVLMGAGIPREIPQLLNNLAAGLPGGVTIEVQGSDTSHRIEIDPAHALRVPLPPLKRPLFLAIVSAAVLATYLARDDSTRPDGYIIEGHVAGGHNAPPRGPVVLNEHNEPTYGPRDDVDLAKIAALGLPFWLAGSYSTPERVREAQELGAAGVQVGTLFALSNESGFSDDLRTQVRDRIAHDNLTVLTDGKASPTGFPFKVAQLPETLSEPDVYDARERVCDLGILRTAYITPKGDIGYRCPSEPVHMYVKKGGDIEDTVGRQCLCNALAANVGKGQLRRGGYIEPPLVTLGSSLDGAAELVRMHPDGWTAADVVHWLLDA